MRYDTARVFVNGAWQEADPETGEIFPPTTLTLDIDPNSEDVDVRPDTAAEGQLVDTSTLLAENDASDVPASPARTAAVTEIAAARSNTPGCGQPSIVCRWAPRVRYMANYRLQYAATGRIVTKTGEREFGENPDLFATLGGGLYFRTKSAGCADWQWNGGFVPCAGRASGSSRVLDSSLSAGDLFHLGKDCTVPSGDTNKTTCYGVHHLSANTWFTAAGVSGTGVTSRYFIKPALTRLLPTGADVKHGQRSGSPIFYDDHVDAPPPSGDGKRHLTYWFFYGFNEVRDRPSGDHQADWESVTVIDPASSHPAFKYCAHGVAWNPPGGDTRPRDAAGRLRAASRFGSRSVPTPPTRARPRPSAPLASGPDTTTPAAAA